MNHKVFIIDDQIVVTGSFNFSRSADESNDENMVFLNNENIAEGYIAEFERVWADAHTVDADSVDCRQY